LRAVGRAIAAPALVVWLGVATACVGAERPQPTAEGAVEWAHYAGDLGGTKYSPASVVHRGNVQRLREAWRIRVGAFPPAAFGHDSPDTPYQDENRPLPVSQFRFQSTPVMRHRALYVSTPLNRVLALDPVNGTTLWTFDPKVDRKRHYLEGFTSRGVTVWVDSERPPHAACALRVFLATVDARLVALDGARGVLCEDFGQGGAIHLERGAGIAGRDARPSDLTVTSPPTVVGDAVVVGSAVRDNRGPGAASGVVRAFDARTGALRWSFDPIPRRPTDAAWNVWSPDAARSTVGANVWSLISADSERDLVFLPTASAAPDFYGGERPGRNDHANSIVALRASTGALVWSFQVVHHDLWDYDLAAQPLLVTLRRSGREVPAVIIGTKTGMIFVLHRETGEPLLPIEERPVPPSDIPGESAWSTQPISIRPPPLLGTQLTPDSAFGVDAAEREYCREAIRRLRNDGLFTPPSFRGTLEWPGFWGGINWDGLAWDPERQRIVTTLKRVAMAVRLHRRGDQNAQANPNEGREHITQPGTPYTATRMPLIAPSGTPCSPPPWGSLLAVDLSEADATVRWRRPLGSVPWLSHHRRYREWGSIAFGGALVTAGGLVFAGASQDAMLRAFDIDNGSQLWEHQLPAAGQATPMTYVVDGQQFIVITAGGRGRMGSPGWIVAFSLPATERNRT